MAILLEPVATEIISPDELLDWALDNIDPMDDDSMLSASERLAALHNNRDFIVHKITEQMRTLLDGHSGSASAQGTVYGTRSGPKGGFSVRSVIWSPPLTVDHRARQLQDRTLSFALPHDHNFSLLTIGYFGSGYTTEIYEYSKDHVLGYPGESVDLTYLGNTQLERGKVIYFRPSRDVHIQHHPQSISISLNLIGQPNNVHSIPQYEFDVKNNKIKRLLSGNAIQSMLMPFQMAIALGGNENMLDVLTALSRVHPSAHIRAASYRTLSTIRPAEGLRFAEIGLSDPSALVRGVAANVLSLK